MVIPAGLPSRGNDGDSYFFGAYFFGAALAGAALSEAFFSTSA